MNATPKVWDLRDTPELRTIPAKDHFVIECEIVQPPSSKGRTVYVFFDVEKTTMLVKQAREAAIYHRSQPMEGGVA